MKGRNIAFDTLEPADGTVLVMYDNTRGEERCPRVIWRDDERAKRYRQWYPKDARWFRNDTVFDPATWGEVLAYATAVHQVRPEPWKVREEWDGK